MRKTAASRSLGCSWRPSSIREAQQYHGKRIKTAWRSRVWSIIYVRYTAPSATVISQPQACFFVISIVFYIFCFYHFFFSFQNGSLSTQFPSYEVLPWSSKTLYGEINLMNNEIFYRIHFWIVYDLLMISCLFIFI